MADLGIESETPVQQSHLRPLDQRRTQISPFCREGVTNKQTFLVIISNVTPFIPEGVGRGAHYDT
ncbi:hypothetical protein SFRURICE_006816 [Spodoptera frugiperda]|nr:hypothetical protein SFRURICE_006816 [Spodoptera frugiperda]